MGAANGSMREPKASEQVVVEVGERGSGRGGGKLDRAVDSPGLAVESTVVPKWSAGDGVPETPSRNEGITTCQRCGRGFVPIGRQLWCSAACRVAAWRQRHAPKGPVAPLPPRGQRCANRGPDPGIRQSREVLAGRRKEARGLGRRVPQRWAVSRNGELDKRNLGVRCGSGDAAGSQATGAPPAPPLARTRVSPPACFQHEDEDRRATPHRRDSAGPRVAPGGSAPTQRAGAPASPIPRGQDSPSAGFFGALLGCGPATSGRGNRFRSASTTVRIEQPAR